ncbi:translocation/assembly module TamB domain-containing protein [Sneathiella litorea]|uniref:Translocation and assembly module TamB C-terminal domain-containing protein n=1 Tax=Sneathiella litorea TaxID=2606216 RepID=A0A6L8WBU4_9PROT|nr:translocation/assembly module TamB domain-containing protein [Sneathiella litorea]MZR32204.1 hypothetical protein [Sneathiella litorea]
MTRKKLIAAIILAPFLILFLAIAGVYVFLQTDSGRALLVDQVNTVASSPGEFELELGPLDGNIFSDFTFQNMRLRDAKGEWLSAENIAVSWAPIDLFSGTLTVNAVTAKTLSVNRQPELPASEASEEPAGMPSLPIDIRLSRLEINEIKIAEPVVGQPADLALLMNFNAKINDIIHSEIKLTELSGPGILLDGSVDFDPARETLALDVKLDEPEGGVISRLLALPGYPAIKVDLVGNGILNAWRGQFSASAGKLFDADFAVATQGAEKITIDLNGGGALDQSLTADIPLLDTSRISVSAALIFDTTNTEVTLTSANIENGVFRLQASGNIDPSNDAIKLATKTTLRNTAPVNDLIAPATISDGTLDLDILGTFEKLTANAILTAVDLDIDNSLAAKSLTGTFTSELDLAALTTVPLTGSAALVSLSKLPDEAQSLVGENLDVDFELAYGVESEQLTISSLRLLGQHVRAEGRGNLNTSDMSATADLSVSLDDLSLVAPMGGELIADLSLSSSDISQKLLGELKARMANLDMGEEKLTVLIGKEPALSLSLDLDLVNESLSVLDINLATGAGGVAGKANLPLAFDTIDADLVATLPSLAKLSDLSGVSLAGKAALNARLTGALTDPSIEGSLKAANLAVDGTSLGIAEVTYNASALASSPIGEFAAKLRHELLTANAKASFAIPDYSRLELSDIALSEQKNKVTGNLTIPFDGMPLFGALKANIPDLATVAALLDEKAAGSVDLDATFANDDGKQSVKATLGANALSLASADLSVEKVTGDIVVTDAFNTPTLDVRANADNIAAAGQKLKELNVSATGDLSDLNYRFDLTRGLDPELELAGSGSVAFTDRYTKLRLAALDGAIADQKIELTTPLSLNLEGKKIDLDMFALSFGTGSVQGSGQYSPDNARANININDLPLELVSLVNSAYAFTGGLDGDIALQVRRGAPAVGTATINVTDIKLLGDEYAELPSFANTINADLKDGELAFNGDVKGLEATSIDLSGRMPFDVSLDQSRILIDENKPVKLKIDIDSDINKIWPLLALDTQIARGQLVASAAVSGTISVPKITGQARLGNGYFEDVEQGTILKNIVLNADISDADKLKIEVNAIDNQGGTLATSGTVDFAKLTNPDVDLNIVLSNLLAVNRDEFTVITDGNIDIKGNPGKLNVGGMAMTRDVQLNIGGSVAPNIVEVKYEEVNKPGAIAKKELEETEPSKIFLKIDLDMPSRVFIRGRGLESEWKGNFKIRGTAAKPVIEGYISPVRGQFAFAGKSFKLVDGEISLLGGETINPELSLTAEYAGSNITAIVTISGTASNPTISFSSTDGRPEDEVLAQVLFGKSSGKLSAVEAVQLAETVAALSGKMGSGGGITGFVRDTLGVDVVSASTNQETGEAEVSVGKYVTDNIYVGVDQGTQSGGTRAKVEIELTPNISVESEMGQSTDSSVGIFWKWDY